MAFHKIMEIMATRLANKFGSSGGQEAKAQYAAHTTAKFWAQTGRGAIDSGSANTKYHLPSGKQT
jgi:hypothetical protein